MRSPMSVDEATKATDNVLSSDGAVDGPVAIQARGVDKTFRIPTAPDRLVQGAGGPSAGSHRVPRAPRPQRSLVRRPSGRVLRHRRPERVGQEHAAEDPREHLQGRRGEDPDGRARWRRSSSSGVGFNPELTARENVVLNGVMMGLSPREARRRLDAVLDFAELEEFVDLKLKNYSSGMHGAPRLLRDDPGRRRHPADRRGAGGRRRRLPAEVRRHVPRDARRRTGRSSSSPTTWRSVETYCDRAMLIHDGELRYVGGSREVGRRLPAAELPGSGPRRAHEAEVRPDHNARLVDAWLEDEAGGADHESRGRRADSLSRGGRGADELLGPVLRHRVQQRRRITVFGINQTLEVPEGEPTSVAPGSRSGSRPRSRTCSRPVDTSFSCGSCASRSPGRWPCSSSTSSTSSSSARTGTAGSSRSRSRSRSWRTTRRTHERRSEASQAGAELRDVAARPRSEAGLSASSSSST